MYRGEIGNHAHLSPALSERSEKSMRKWRVEVSAAALAFESRWTMLALRRVDADLASRLFEQRGLFDKATITGTAEEIEQHGAAMCRGYAAAVRALEASGAEDDSYLIGRCPRTAQVVAIGDQRACVGRVRELFGPDAVWVTPDEVATLYASAEGIRKVKLKWPGAEVTECRDVDPAGLLAKAG